MGNSKQSNNRKTTQSSKTRTNSKYNKNSKNSKNSKSSKNNKKVKFSVKHPKAAIALKVIAIVIIVLLVVGAGILVGMVYGNWGQDFEITEEELILSGNSVILDSDGNVLAELTGDETRKIISLEEMSDYLIDAYVAIEDERFYKHSGVDIKRTAGAIVTYIANGGSSSFGGSTITQQLVKNITQDTESTGLSGATRKVKEWVKAYQIEQMLSKDQILELYLNVIFVGSSYYGVEMGAEYYFDKSADELSLVECAFLAGINNAPNAYSPYGDSAYGEDEEKTEKINSRTKTVLAKMLELDYITQEEYDNACAEVDEGIEFEQGVEIAENIYSYHTDATISQIVDDLVEEKNWSEEYAETYVYGGGLTIYSTQDTEVQEEIEEVMVENASSYSQTSSSTGETAQAATVVIDSETGYVVGCVGGLGEKTTSRGLNRATQSYRQPGSSIKPLADLLPGLEEGIITAATLYNDCATEFEGEYTPEDESSYKGIISVRTAITKSQNVPFVKIMAELTTSVSKSYMKQLGITSLDDTNDNGLALAIGGLYTGVSPLEMAAAYAAIENDGVYRTPLFYTKVTDSAGNIVLEPEQESVQVCSAQNAYIIKDMLKDVVESSSGTATYAKISGIDMAAKTGTTDEHYDRWLCGFTNYYTAVTWYGFDTPEYVNSVSGINPAGKIYTAVMKSLHEDKEDSEFEEPDGIVSVKVCKNTGLKATSSCSSTYTEIFAEGAEPDECDEGSSAVTICSSSGKLANEYCPSTYTKYASYVIEKERLGLWTNLSSSSSSSIPTETCTEHTSETATVTSTSKPTITLKGSQNMTLEVGDTYTEKGATATDETDGDISSQIQISGSVNTSKAGTYTVTYTVTNSNDLTTTVTRTVTVKDTTSSTNNTTKNTTGNTTANNTTTTNPNVEDTGDDDEDDSGTPGGEDD